MNGNTTCLWRCLAWSGPFQRVICRDSQTHVISTKVGKERNTDRKTCLCSWREAAASVGVAPIEWWTIKEKHHGIHRAGSRFASSSRLVFDFPSALLPTESGWTGGEGAGGGGGETTTCETAARRQWRCQWLCRCRLRRSRRGGQRRGGQSNRAGLCAEEEEEKSAIFPAWERRVCGLKDGA